MTDNNNVANFTRQASPFQNDKVYGGTTEYTKDAILRVFGDSDLGESDYEARWAEFVANALSQILPKPYSIKSSDYTLTNEDFYIELDTSGITATLNTINPVLGEECHVDNSSTDITYVTPIGALAETLMLAAGEGSYFVYNGTHWRIK